MKAIRLVSGKASPILGQGMSGMGVKPSKREDEIASLRLGVDLGMTHIDTAEMYGEGKSEILFAEALSDRRGEVFLTSKVLPEHATYRGTLEACEKSLKRLKTDYIDLYLLHWMGNAPLHETFNAFMALKKDGKIKDFGVSNFDTQDMEKAYQMAGGHEIAANQVLYNLRRRVPEWSLSGWLKKHNMPLIAYTPIDRGGLESEPSLKKIAERHNKSVSQIALAWVLQRPNVIAIPKAGTPQHVQDNFDALSITLTAQDLAEIDLSFPPPKSESPLETL
jgi:diketogulonate reductase-like aldo/keto reductase